ncbi:MAG: hypothetical protein ACXIVQ_12200 [Acidimicrobiales bacterium]
MGQPADVDGAFCGDHTDHDPHLWRPDAKKVTTRSRRDRLRWCNGVTTPEAPSSMTDAVERVVAELDTPDIALVQLARTLASDLDERRFIDKPNVSAIAKELRAVLADLREAHDRHDDPAGDLAASMSSAVRDTPTT